MTTLSPHRTGRITGSRIAAVLGASPWAGPDDVLRDMVRQALGAPDEFTGNRATEWGQAHELDGIYEWEARHDAALMATGDFQEFVPHPDVEFLGVTPDGRAADGVVEVKAPLWGGYTHWREVPWYECQIRLAIACTGSEWGDLAVWRPEGTAISRVEDDPWWLEQQMPVLEKFYDRYETTLADPALFAPFLRPLVDVRTDPEWVDAAYRYRELAALADVADRELADARAALLAVVGDEQPSEATPIIRVRGAGVLVTRSTRAGAVDWKRLKAEHAPTVDESEYRKDSTVVTAVRLTASE